MKMIMKNKQKKKHKISKIILLLGFYIIFCYSFYYSMKNNKNITNEEFIKMLLKNGNYDILNSNIGIDLVNNTIKYTLNIDFTKPNTLLNSTIFKKTNNKKNNSKINIEYSDDYSNMEELKKVSSYIKDPSDSIVTDPIVYIYNSHQLENYSNEKLEIYGITPNVLMASYLLKEKLNKLGIPTIVEDTNISELLHVNGWDYSYSYKASRLLILSKLNEYNSIKYLIDVHRDSVSKDMTTITINGKNYAKVLFVVGQDHDNWAKNMDIANKINNLINNNCNGLSRGILKKSGYGVDGIYNQDISSNSILIEIGSTDNTIDEVLNTINVLSNVLYKYIKEEWYEKETLN